VRARYAQDARYERDGRAGGSSYLNLAPQTSRLVPNLRPELVKISDEDEDIVNPAVTQDLYNPYFAARGQAGVSTALKLVTVVSTGMRASVHAVAKPASTPAPPWRHPVPRRH